MALSMRSTLLSMDYWRIPAMQFHIPTSLSLPASSHHTKFHFFTWIFQALSIISQPLHKLLENSLVYSFKVENTHSLWLRNYVSQQKPIEMHTYNCCTIIIAKILKWHKYIFYGFVFNGLFLQWNTIHQRKTKLNTDDSHTHNVEKGTQIALPLLNDRETKKQQIGEKGHDSIYTNLCIFWNWQNKLSVELIIKVVINLSYMMETLSGKYH